MEISNHCYFNNLPAEILLEIYHRVDKIDFPSRGNFNNLPDEMLLEIYHRVDEIDFPSLALTCKYFHQLLEKCYHIPSFLRDPDRPLSRLYQITKKIENTLLSKEPLKRVFHLDNQIPKLPHTQVGNYFIQVIGKGKILVKDLISEKEKTIVVLGEVQACVGMEIEEPLVIVFFAKYAQTYRLSQLIEGELESIFGFFSEEKPVIEKHGHLLAVGFKKNAVVIDFSTSVFKINEIPEENVRQFSFTKKHLLCLRETQYRIYNLANFRGMGCYVTPQRRTSPFSVSTARALSARLLGNKQMITVLNGPTVQRTMWDSKVDEDEERLNKFGDKIFLDSSRSHWLIADSAHLLHSKNFRSKWQEIPLNFQEEIQQVTYCAQNILVVTDQGYHLLNPQSLKCRHSRKITEEKASLGILGKYLWVQETRPNQKVSISLYDLSPNYTELT